MRNDAVTAVEQAAVLHFDERSPMAIETGNPLRCSPHAEGMQLFGNASLVGEDFDDTRQPRHGLGIARGIAAHDDECSTGIGLSQAADKLTPLGVRFVGNGTGIDNTQISSLT